MRLSPRLQEDKLDRRRKSAGKLFQASIYLQKVPDRSLLDALIGFRKTGLLQRKLRAGS
jgi:hypothetical protein